MGGGENAHRPTKVDWVYRTNIEAHAMHGPLNPSSHSCCALSYETLKVCIETHAVHVSFNAHVHCHFLVACPPALPEPVLKTISYWMTALSSHSIEPCAMHMSFKATCVITQWVLLSIGQHWDPCYAWVFQWKVSCCITSLFSQF